MYPEQVKAVRDELDEAAIAGNKFTKAVNGSDTSKFGKTVSENAKALKDLNLSDKEFRYAFETDGAQEGKIRSMPLYRQLLTLGSSVTHQHPVLRIWQAG